MSSDRPTRRATLLSLAAAGLLGGCAAHGQAQAQAQAQGRDKPEEARDLSFLEGKFVRVVPKGGAMTMDYRPDRLTILLDEQQKIERAYFG